MPRVQVFKLFRKSIFITSKSRIFDSKQIDRLDDLFFSSQVLWLGNYLNCLYKKIFLTGFGIIHITIRNMLVLKLISCSFPTSIWWTFLTFHLSVIFYRNLQIKEVIKKERKNFSLSPNIYRKKILLISFILTSHGADLFVSLGISSNSPTLSL